MKYFVFIGLLIIGFAVTSCKKEGCTDENALNYNKKAKKDDGSCTYAPAYTVPTTYAFTNANGVNTVDYSGQTDRVNQLKEMMAYIKSGKDGVIQAAVIDDMFANQNDPFTFTSTKQLRDKCFSLDLPMFDAYIDSVALASVSYAQSASNGQAGTLTTGTSEYLFSANGIEYAQLIEKGLMGAIFQYQALNVYFGAGKMNVDNTTPVSGQAYTAMEHHWDEAFGYFTVPTDFPTTPATDFWGKYCAAQNGALNSNSVMMNNFLKGRAAISANVLTDRDAAIQSIREMWENIAAYQAMTYLDQAISSFGTDQAKFLHVTSEAYAFILCLRYAPTETRNLSTQQVSDLLAEFGTNFWNLTLADLQNIKATLDANY